MVNKAIHLIQAARSNGVFVSVANDQLSIKYSKEKNIEPELLEEIKNNKELIIDFLNNKKLNSKPFAPENQIGLIKRDSTQQLPLSFNQERLWFIDRLEGSLQYHIPAVWRLRGNLNKQALAKALQGIVNRHEVLHTVFPEKENQAYQCITSADGWRLEVEYSTTPFRP
jgi:hypothetical protein